MTKETKIMTIREAIKEAMTHEMREDENVFLMEMCIRDSYIYERK